MKKMFAFLLLGPLLLSGAELLAAAKPAAKQPAKQAATRQASRAVAPKKQEKPVKVYKSNLKLFKERASH